MGIVALNFKTGNLVMYRQWGHTIHLLQLPKCTLLSSLADNPLFGPSSAGLSRLVEGLWNSIDSARVRSSGRSSSLSSLVMVLISKVRGQL